jgi:hypothetical protein
MLSPAVLAAGRSAKDIVEHLSTQPFDDDNSGRAVDHLEPILINFSLRLVSAHETAEVVGESMEPKANRLGNERIAWHACPPDRWLDLL